MKHLALLVAAIFGLAACSSAAPSVVPDGSTGPRASASETVPSVPAPITFTAEHGGLELVAMFDRLIVEPGGDVTVQLSLNNTRAEDVIFSEPCGQSRAMIVKVPNPVEPIGREWDGIAGAFKTYALNESTGTPIESSIRTPLETLAKGSRCHAPSQGEPSFATQTIPAGENYETTFTWSAELVKDLPAGAGEVPFSIEVQHDIEAEAGGMFRADTLSVDGTITVLPGGPKAVTAGEALDVALGDPEFAAWLAKQPRKSWDGTNLFLQPPAVGVDFLPVVPYWSVELFRVPRNFAILYVDASEGSVLKRIICDSPCDR
jgi:hypothetical protein